MSGQAPPAIPPKHADRAALMSDLQYFAQEAVRRAEQLYRIDKSWRKPRWQQTAALARRVRNEARFQADEHRRRQKRRAA